MAFATGPQTIAPQFYKDITMPSTDSMAWRDDIRRNSRRIGGDRE